MSEFGRAGAAIAVAQDHIGTRNACAAFTHLAADCIHGVAVDVIAHAKLLMVCMDQILQLCLIGQGVALNALVHFVNRQFALVNGAAIVQGSPYQRLANVGFATGLIGVGPVAFNHGQVDIAHVSVGVDVGAGKFSQKQMRAMVWGMRPQFVDEDVFTIAQVF